MYLKEINASGFKSFADKLEIKLDGKTTCIVGPNGSGKSNVVDAVAAFSSSTGNSLDEVVRCIACAEHLSRSGGVDTGVAVAAFALPEFNIDRSAVVDGQRQGDGLAVCVGRTGVG